MLQEDYIKEEQRNLKRELLRAQEEVRRIQSVPLVIGQFLEMVDNSNGIVGSTTGAFESTFICLCLNTDLLRPFSKQGFGLVKDSMNAIISLSIYCHSLLQVTVLQIADLELCIFPNCSLGVHIDGRFSQTQMLYHFYLRVEFRGRCNENCLCGM